MKEHPILFSGDMVRAILDGRKTQTRRLVKHYFSGGIQDNPWSPFGKPGDRLWVRETWVPPHQNDCGKISPLCYRATNPDPSMLRWKPSIHMPRWASRITLEIVSVRVERLQDITDAGAKAEGFDAPAHMPRSIQDPKAWFHGLWNSVYGNGAFEQNPLVWVVEFKLLEAA